MVGIRMLLMPFQGGKMKKEVIEKLAALLTAAFGLVAALAWNDAIKALFKGPCGAEGAGSLCMLSSNGPWAYAILVTIIAVIVIVYIGRVSERANERLEAGVKKVKSVSAPKKKSSKKKK